MEALFDRIFTQEGIAIVVLCVACGWLAMRLQARDKVTEIWMNKYEQLLEKVITSNQQTITALEVIKEKIKQ